MKKFIIILCLAIVGSCKDKTNTEYVYLPSEVEENITSVKSDGVVDGSGGNLVKTTFDDFEFIVKNRLPFYLEDLLQRTEIIFKSYDGYDFIGFIPVTDHVKTVSDMFLNDSYLVQKKISQISFNPKKSKCETTNHKTSHTDAGMSDDGVMCLSYESFKSLKDQTLIRQLLIMSMHEMSHYVGYDEDQAEIVQDFFENNLLGRDLILHDSSNLEIYLVKRNEETDKWNSILRNFKRKNYDEACHQYSYSGLSSRYSVTHYYLPRNIQNVRDNNFDAAGAKGFAEVCHQIVKKGLEINEEHFKKMKNSLIESTKYRQETLKLNNEYFYPRIDIENTVFQNVLKDIDVTTLGEIEKSEFSFEAQALDDQKNISCSIVDDLVEDVLIDSQINKRQDGMSITEVLKTNITRKNFGFNKADTDKRYRNIRGRLGDNYEFTVHMIVSDHAKGFDVIVKSNLYMNVSFNTPKRNYGRGLYGLTQFYDEDGSFELGIDILGDYDGITDGSNILSPSYNSHFSEPKVLKKLKLSCEIK